MCDRTGWTWKYVWEELDMDRVEALERQWQREPPVGLLVAQYLGYKPPAVAEAARPAGGSGLLQLLEMFPSGRIGS